MCGTVNKTVVAGSVAYKVYETSVQHFVSQGNDAFYKCNNKGCDPSQPVALVVDPINTSPANFTLTLNFTLPLPQKTGLFTVDFVGQDQDHYPYVIVGTVSLQGTCTSDKDCPTGSYCMNGPGSYPPYNCHA